MLRTLLLFSLSFFINTIFAQPIIKGRVVNVATGLPVPNCNVFITNTSKGSVTDAEGTFILINIPPGKHELVVSNVGFETSTYSFSREQLPLQLKIELAIKVKELENVTIEPSVEEGWDKWGKLFTDYFIGTTGYTNSCKIKNKESIKFRFYKKSNRLIAYCDEPIIIENRALGYTISYQLEDFESNFTEKTVSFVGYSFFEEMKDDRKKWQRNRMKVYNGSMMHFFRSLYSNRLQEEGFDVRRMIRIPNLEKQRVRLAYSKAMRLSNNNNEGNTLRIDNNVSSDTLSYYRKVLQQDDYKDVYADNLLNADSLFIEKASEYKVISFDDYLYIVFRNGTEDPEYVKTQYPARAPTRPRSKVTLLNEKIITFDANGNYYDPQNFFASGYWGWSEKIGTMLPLDFEPVNNGQ